MTIRFAGLVLACLATSFYAPMAAQAKNVRLDTKDTMPPAVEIAEQRPVVRADIVGQIRRLERVDLRNLAIQLREVIAQDLRSAAGVGVARWE